MGDVDINKTAMESWTEDGERRGCLDFSNRSVLDVYYVNKPFLCSQT